jgi:hypothetical protein
MADFEDAQRIALTLPKTTAEGTHIGVRRGAKVKGMAWLWNERIGFPAVLVRLAAVDETELRELLIDAWRCQAPPALVRESDL